MDRNIQFVIDQRVNRTIENLKKNNMEGYYVPDEKGLIEKLKELLNDGDTVSVGGSMTLFETGVIDFIRNGNYNFLDRYEEGLTPSEIKDIFRKSFSADAYIASSNAITENGELYNVDGNGNRVAAMIYGPDKVIVIVGINKIVKDVDEAMKRCSKVASPANCKRLNKNTPCVKLGYCIDCSSSERICNDYVLIKKQSIKGRINVIIIGKQFGY